MITTNIQNKFFNFVNDIKDEISRISDKASDLKRIKTVDNNHVSSDVGWGCMIRSSQMLLANCLTRLFNRDAVIEMFEPNGIFSLNEYIKHGSRPSGEWYGPSSASWVLENLVSHSNIGVNIQVCQDIVSEPLQYPTLLLIPTRLGLDKINPIYYDFLKKSIKIEQSVGIIGGTPKHALYFYNSSSDSNDLYYLDPHIVQDASNSSKLTYNCNTINKISIDRLDPNFGLGFLMKDKDDYENFTREISTIEKHSLSFELNKYQDYWDWDWDWDGF